MWGPGERGVASFFSLSFQLSFFHLWERTANRDGVCSCRKYKLRKGGAPKKKKKIVCKDGDWIEEKEGEKCIYSGDRLWNYDSLSVDWWNFRVRGVLSYWGYHTFDTFFFFFIYSFSGPKGTNIRLSFFITKCNYVCICSKPFTRQLIEWTGPAHTDSTKEKKERKKKNWVNGNEADLVEEGLLFGSAWLSKLVTIRLPIAARNSDRRFFF